MFETKRTYFPGPNLIRQSCPYIKVETAWVGLPARFEVNLKEKTSYLDDF